MLFVYQLRDVYRLLLQQQIRSSSSLYYVDLADDQYSSYLC